ncbi:MAG: helix-turn-helix transcriptional regulator [Rhodospirillales bacterium]|nr:helix-turn-helix transcriptional regulator [Rhodospirillales bacterium]
MQHNDLWRALDTLAAEHGLSVSGLARRAGLDPTTFTPAKRRMRDGRVRWPSTESLAKVLEATRTPIESFTALVTGARALPSASPRAGLRRLPLLPLPAAATDGFFDADGRPTGTAPSEVSLPEIGDPAAYALAVADEQMAPVFRTGDIIIASPAAPVRHGDRVVVRLRQGALFARELIERAARRLVLRRFSPLCEFRFDPAEISFLHRIVWASQ